jgi:[ribosomal protein S5]-alanine N-acetyltransferase
MLMEELNFELIQTERLILRKISPSNFIFLFENYSESEIKHVLGLKTEQDFEKEKNRYLKGFTTYNQSIEPFQLIYRDSNEIIGGCGFHNWYPLHQRAELGYAISNSNYLNKGLMTEALEAIIYHGFTKMDLQRIEALVAPNNNPSLKLLAKFGFIQEGILRKHYNVNGNFEDSILFSKLISEFEKP